MGVGALTGSPHTRRESRAAIPVTVGTSRARPQQRQPLRFTKSGSGQVPSRRRMGRSEAVANPARGTVCPEGAGRAGLLPAMTVSPERLALT